MKNIKEFKFVFVPKRMGHACTVCEQKNGECIADTMPIVDDNNSEIDCPSNYYPEPILGLEA